MFPAGAPRFNEHPIPSSAVGCRRGDRNKERKAFQSERVRCGALSDGLVRNRTIAELQRSTGGSPHDVRSTLALTNNDVILCQFVGYFQRAKRKGGCVMRFVALTGRWRQCCFITPDPRPRRHGHGSGPPSTDTFCCVIDLFFPLQTFYFEATYMSA